MKASKSSSQAGGKGRKSEKIDRDQNSSRTSLPPLDLPKLPSISAGLPPFQIPDSIDNLSYGHQQYDQMRNSSSSSSSVMSNSPSTASNFSNTEEDTNTWIKTHPRSNWNVRDDKLKPVPLFHPPPIPSCCSYIADDSSPSTVAARISECLRKRSLIADYDDEAATAMVFSVDQCVFSISLYRGGKGAAVQVSTDGIHNDDIGSACSSTKQTSCGSGRSGSQSIFTTSSTMMVRPDFSQGVIVECQRKKGDTIAFHRNCQAVLASARGDSDGLDDQRKPLTSIMQSPFSFKPNHSIKRPKRLQHKESKSSSKLAHLTCTGLETTMKLIEKDRLDAQVLGMQSLVSMTDSSKTSLDISYMTSLCILGSPMNLGSSPRGTDSDEYGNSSIHRIHEKIIDILSCFQSADDESSCSTPIVNRELTGVPIDVEYKVSLRRLAMLCAANALSVMVKHSHDFPLVPQPSCEVFCTKEIMETVALDLEGATRPPMTSEDLTSAHDAALAARFLRLLIGYRQKEERQGNSNSIQSNDVNVCNTIKGVRVGNPPRPVIDFLERAQGPGMSCHKVLEREVRAALNYLAADDDLICAK